LRDHLHRILRGAVEAVDPSRLLESVLSAGAIDSLKHSSVNLVAAGKAAWPMASAFVRHARVTIRAGIVAGLPAAGGDIPDSFERFTGGHPTPDEESERAGRRALAIARDPDAALIVLLSGGASSMLAVPAEGITLDDKVSTFHNLLQGGVPIAELNCVRKHLSAVKGGQLGVAASESFTFAISDVHGPVADDASVIGSGPTVGDPTTFEEALAILQRAYADDAREFPHSVLRHLEQGARGEIDETPKPGDVRLLRSRYQVIGNRMTAMQGAAAVATDLGYAVHLLDEPTSGEARIAGARFAMQAERSRADGPFCVIASGEPTVRVRGAGQGGRNQEFALAMAAALAEARLGGHFAIGASAGTDGIDGPTNAAGAVVDWTTLERARKAGLSVEDALARNDTYPLFSQLGDLIVWGPTGTNVGDIHVLLSTSRLSP
jgi:glycerate-2-kinase